MNSLRLHDNHSVLTGSSLCRLTSWHLSPWSLEMCQMRGVLTTPASRGYWAGDTRVPESETRAPAERAARPASSHLVTVICMPRRIRRGEKLIWKINVFWNFVYAWNQYSHSCPAKTGNNSCGVDTSLLLSAVTCWIWNTHFFALIWNFNFVLKSVSPSF